VSSSSLGGKGTGGRGGSVKGPKKPFNNGTFGNKSGLACEGKVKVSMESMLHSAISLPLQLQLILHLYILGN
jgi:hypothetical protein